MQLPSRCCLHRLDETSRAPSASSESQDASCHGCPMHQLRSIEKQTSLLSRRNPWSKSCSLYWKTMTRDYLNWPIKIKWFHLSLCKVGCPWCRCIYLRKTEALEIRTQIYCPYEHLPSRISAEQLVQLVSYHHISTTVNNFGAERFHSEICIRQSELCLTKRKKRF